MCLPHMHTNEDDLFFLVVEMSIKLLINFVYVVFTNKIISFSGDDYVKKKIDVK